MQAWLPVDVAPPPSDAWDPDTWCTPKWLADMLPEFDLDPCSNSRSHIRAKARHTIETNGLAQPWRGLVFCNPPYSKPMPWCVAADDCAANGGTVLFLPKLDPSTQWWGLLMSRASAVGIFSERLQFEGGSSSGNNFCSALLCVGDLAPVACVFEALESAGKIWKGWRL